MIKLKSKKNLQHFENIAKSKFKRMKFLLKIFILCFFLILESSGGLVFGIPLAQCLENDRLARIASGEIADVGSLARSSRHGSRSSFTSLIETPSMVAAKTEEVSKKRFFYVIYMKRKCFISECNFFIILAILYSRQKYQTLYSFVFII